MNAKNIKHVLLNEYIYSVITKFLTIGIGLIQSIIIARYLGPELKGVNAYIASITSVGDIIISLGIHQAYPSYRRDYGKDSVECKFFSAALGMYGILELIAIIAIYVVHLSDEIKAAILLIPIMGYNRVISYITYVEKPNKINTWTTIVQIAYLAYAAFLWVFTKPSFFTSVSLLYFFNIISAIIYTLLLSAKPVFDERLISFTVELVRYGFIPMIALLMTTLNYRIDVIMLHQFSNINNAMIGIYSLGLTLSDKIVLIPDTLKNVLVSKLSKGAPDSEVAKVSRLGFFCSVILCILVFLLGKPVILLFYGIDYIDAYEIILITSIGVLAVSYFKIISQYNIVNNKQNLNVAMLSIAILVDIFFNIALIPLLGINGAAIATALGNIVCGIVFVAYFCRRTSIRLLDMFLIKKSDLTFLAKAFKH